MPPPPGDSSPTSPLPPGLADLYLHSAVSPRALASLQIPSTLTSLDSCRLRFGTSDTNQETGQLLLEAAAAVGPAVQRMKAAPPFRPFRLDGSLGWFWLLTADGAEGPLLPRAGAPDGHAEWLGQLGALDGVDLALRGFALQVEDVCCLAHTLGKVKNLTIGNCKFPVAASGLLGLWALEKLDVDLRHAMNLSGGSLETALTVLCSQAPALQRVTCRRCPLSNCQELQAAILDQLRGKGKDGMQLTIRRPW